MSTIKNLLSFVVPVKDEEKTIRELFDRIAHEVTALERNFEIIFIDDGSTDSSWEVIQTLATENPGKIVAFRFRRNCGKADALATGFEAARGEIVFTLDADLQDDPKEIPRFIAKLDEGFDIVSGWKQTRHDPWHKVLPSRVFNRMLSRVNGVSLHDHNCGFKCYRAEVIKSVSLYGEMHRMIPSLGSIKGYRSSEIAVQHHPRLHGQSKYGVKRFLRGFMDMQTVYFLKNFRERPLHLFGGLALTAFVLAALFFTVGFVPGLTVRMSTRLTIIAEGLAASSLPLMALGFLAELVVHGRVEKERRPVISETLKKSGVKQDNPDNVIAMTLPPMPDLQEMTTHPSGKPVILIADDQPRMRELMRLQLEDVGVQVDEAGDGNEAIAKMTDYTAVVLLDLDMPGKGGLECLTHIKKYRSDVQVIIVSANEEVMTAVRVMKLGALDYVSKPFNGEQLVKAVRKALQVRGHHAELLQHTA